MFNLPVDNAALAQSDVRATDRTFVHNLDRMVELAGGKVVGRRWEGDRQVDGQTIYFVFALPPARTEHLSGSRSRLEKKTTYYLCA